VLTIDAVADQHYFIETFLNQQATRADSPKVGGAPIAVRPKHCRNVLRNWFAKSAFWKLGILTKRSCSKLRSRGWRLLCGRRRNEFADCYHGGRGLPGRCWRTGWDELARVWINREYRYIVGLGVAYK
jgi:hypothetical protein